MPRRHREDPVEPVIYDVDGAISSVHVAGNRIAVSTAFDGTHIIERSDAAGMEAFSMRKAITHAGDDASVTTSVMLGDTLCRGTDGGLITFHDMATDIDAACATNFRAEVLDMHALGDRAVLATTATAVSVIDASSRVVTARLALSDVSFCVALTSSAVAAADYAGQVSVYDLRNPSVPMVQALITDKITSMCRGTSVSVFCGTACGRIVSLRVGDDAVSDTSINVGYPGSSALDRGPVSAVSYTRGCVASGDGCGRVAVSNVASGRSLSWRVPGICTSAHAAGQMVAVGAVSTSTNPSKCNKSFLFLGQLKS